MLSLAARERGPESAFGTIALAPARASRSSAVFSKPMTTLVAVSASYGAAGGRIAPALAEWLGVPFLDRAIPMAVADRLAVPFDDAAAHDEQVSTRWTERMLTGLLGSDIAGPVPLPAGAIIPDDFRRATEEVLLRQAATEEGVILGRAAVVVLRDDPRALRVRLHGPAERRTRQAMRLHGVDEATARRTMRRLDKTHAAYMKKFYGASLDDPRLYHLVIDTTALDLDACVEMIALAAGALTLRTD
jgi:hypothetical protein